MKKLFLTILCAAILGGVQLVRGQGEQAFTLEEAVKYAVANQVQMVNAKMEVQDADQQIYEVRAIGLPKVNASVNYQRFLKLPTSLIPAEIFDPNAEPGTFAEVQFGTKNNFTASVEASMLIFDGTYLVGLEAARLLRNFTAIQLDQVAYSIEKNVVKAYVSTLIFEETQKVLQKNIKNLEQLLFETEQLYKEGFAEQLDVDRLVLSLQNLRTDSESLTRQYEIVKNALKFSMGYPMEQDLQVKDNLEGLMLSPAFSVSESDELNLANRPEVQVADKGLELAALDIKRYQKAYLPTVSVFTSLQEQYFSDNVFKKPYNFYPTIVAGFQVTAPIFDGFEKRSKIQRAQIYVEQSKNERKELVRAIELEVINARIAYTNAKIQLENQDKNLNLAERIYNTTRTKYNEGVGSSLELSQAEQSLYQTQANRLNALYSFLVAKSDLAQALSK